MFDTAVNSNDTAVYTNDTAVNTKDTAVNINDTALNVNETAFNTKNTTLNGSVLLSYRLLYSLYLAMARLTKYTSEKYIKQDARQEIHVFRKLIIK